MSDQENWEQWCSIQTWHANVLPHLKSLGIHCVEDFSQSECLDNSPLLRLVGWTRAQMTPPLEHLNVWEGRGTKDDILVDYISTEYLKKHPGLLGEKYDAIIVRGMATQHLVIGDSTAPLLQLRSTVFFRRLQDLVVDCYRDHEIPILPCLEQIKRLEIRHGIIPVIPLNLDLPLTHTLQSLKLRLSTFSWMIGRTFKALREFQNDRSPVAPENLSRREGLQVDLPACTTLKLENCPIGYLHLLSCPNVQILRWWQFSAWTAFDLAALDSLHDSISTLSCLQKLYISILQYPGLGSLIHFVFYSAWERRVWRDIRGVEMGIRFSSSPEAFHFFDQIVEHQQHYENWWKTFIVTKDDRRMRVIVKASM